MSTQFARFALFALALSTLQATVVHAAPGTSQDAAEPDDPIERARLHFRLGVDFYREKNYRAALIEFQRAYAASPHYKLLYNLGQASLELQEDNNAIGYFTRYLAEGTNEISDERRAEVEQNIIKLRARLGTVTVRTNQAGAEIYMDDTRIGVAPLRDPVKVSVGRRKFVAVKHGFSDVERVIDVAAGEEVVVELEFRAQPQIDISKLRVQAAPRPEEDATSPAMWTGFATAAVAAGAGTMSILTVVAQNRYNEERKGLTSRAQLERFRDDAKTKALVADVLWGVTVAGAGLTAVLLFTSGGSERESAVSVRVQPTGLKVAGAF
jgi:tetratricopeptide (TPR) repeat protein